MTCFCDNIFIVEFAKSLEFDCNASHNIKISNHRNRTLALFFIFFSKLLFSQLFRRSYILDFFIDLECEPFFTIWIRIRVFN